MHTQPDMWLSRLLTLGSFSALVGLVGCQAPVSDSDPVGIASAQGAQQASLLGDACTTNAQCANTLVCGGGLCIPDSGLSVKPRCSVNAAAYVTLLQRDPDAPFTADGPAVTPSYTNLGTLFSTNADGNVVSFPSAGAGMYIISIKGQGLRAQETAEFEYDGSPTLMTPAYDGWCFPEAPRG